VLRFQPVERRAREDRLLLRFLGHEGKVYRRASISILSCRSS
jgi:hypothetical protein